MLTMNLIKHNIHLLLLTQLNVFLCDLLLGLELTHFHVLKLYLTSNQRVALLPDLISIAKFENAASVQVSS